MKLTNTHYLGIVVTYKYAFLLLRLDAFYLQIGEVRDWQTFSICTHNYVMWYKWK
jgi:hypothetical protein